MCGISQLGEEKKKFSDTHSRRWTEKSMKEEEEKKGEWKRRREKGCVLAVIQLWSKTHKNLKHAQCV